MTGKWIIFSNDVSQNLIDTWMNMHPDVNGYYVGIPPFLLEKSLLENWTLPRIWEEIPENNLNP
jgi:hypothetical protein